MRFRARAAHAEGRLTREELRPVEDRAIAAHLEFHISEQNPALKKV